MFEIDWLTILFLLILNCRDGGGYKYVTTVLTQIAPQDSEKSTIPTFASEKLSSWLRESWGSMDHVERPRHNSWVRSTENEVRLTLCRAVDNEMLPYPDIQTQMHPDNPPNTKPHHTAYLHFSQSHTLLSNYKTVQCTLCIKLLHSGSIDRDTIKENGTDRLGQWRKNLA